MTEVRVSDLIYALNDWIDSSPRNNGRDSEALLWGRVAKLSEEVGEVNAALIGITGQNPRKGVSHSLADLEAELWDVALTAVCLVAHLRRNAGEHQDLLRDLESHIRSVVTRALGGGGTHGGQLI